MIETRDADDARREPALLIREIALGMRASRALEVVARLGIADCLGDGPRSSAELAAATSADAQSLRRVMRAMVAGGIFAEPEPDRFALNPAGKLLRSDTPLSMRAGALFLAGDLRWQLWSDLLTTVRTGQPAPERIFGHDIFTQMAKDPGQSALSSAAMAEFSASMSAAVVAAYDFSRFRCLVDVGGGTGRLLGDILSAHPSLSGILLDLPHVVAAAPAMLQASGIADRCRIEAGSFFDGVPPGGEAYLLKQVLHDWNDQRATAILSRCHDVLAADGVLLILERVMPERAEAGKAVEAHLLDLEMLVATPYGRERTEAEFRAILAAARLVLTRVIPTASPLSVIEARPSRSLG